MLTLKNRERLLFLALFVLSLAIRLAFNAYYVGFDTPPGKSVLLASDETKYHSLALSLLEGHGFNRTAYMPPGVPFFMACVYRICGVSFAAVRIVQCILSSFMVLMIAGIASTVFGRKAGVASGCIASVYPFFVFWTGAMITETLFLFLCIASVFCLMHYLQKERMLWNCASGILLGLATLTRPVTLSIPFFVVCTYVIWFRNLKKTVVGSVVFCALFLAVLLPWTVRNYCIFDRVVPVASISGVSMLAGVNSLVIEDPSRVGDIIYHALPEIQELRKKGYDEARFDNEAGKIARNYYRDLLCNNLPVLFRLEWEKCKRFWRIVPENRGRLAQVVSVGSYGLLLPFFIIGMCASLRNKKSYILLFSILNTFLIGLVYYANIRYRVLMEPFYVMYAAYGLVVSFSLSRCGNLKLHDEDVAGDRQ